MTGMPMPRYDLWKKNRYVNCTFVQTCAAAQGCTALRRAADERPEISLPARR